MTLAPCVWTSKGFFFWCDPWTDCPIKIFISSSEKAEQTSKQLLLSWPSQCSHHATCCRGSWTVQTKVISHMLIHMFTLLHLMHTLTQEHEIRTHVEIRTHMGGNILTVANVLDQKTEIQIMKILLRIEEDKTNLCHSWGPYFAVICVLSCQVNHEGTV